MDASLHPSSPEGSGLSPEVLLERMERVRALASQLVRQAADRDDLVQEAVARALAHPQVLTGDPEPWLRRVLKNLVIDRQRSNQRRERREHDAQPTETVAASTVDAVARAEKQRDLVDAVLSLKDPYRTVLLRRYFDGEPPRRIAEELDVAVPTVKKQLERGMALVRKRLEGRYGDQGAWAVALLPILPRRALDALTKSVATTAAATGAAAWSWPVVLGGGGILAAATFLAVNGLSGTGTGGPPEFVAVPENATTLAAGEPQENSAVAPRIAANATVAGAAASPEAAFAPRTYDVKFIDDNASPIDGVEVFLAEESIGPMDLEAATRLGTTSASGELIAPLPGARNGPLMVIARADGFAPARLRVPANAGSAVSGGTQVLHRPAELRVRVVNESGTLLDGWTAGYFQHGPGGRLDAGRATIDSSRGYALFSELSAAPVEISATHPSGARIDHPRRSLSADQSNAVDLTFAGSDPARRIGINLTVPPIASTMRASGPVEIQVERDGALVAKSSVALTSGPIALENLESASSLYTLRIDDPRFSPVAIEATSGKSTAINLHGSAALELSLRTERGAPMRIKRAFGLGREKVPLEVADGAAASQRLDNLVPGEPFRIWLEGDDRSHAAVEVTALQPGEVRRLDVRAYEGVRTQVVRVTRASLGGEVPVALAPVGLFMDRLATGSREERQALAWLKGNSGVAAPPSLVFSGRTDRAGELRVPVAVPRVASGTTQRDADDASAWTLLTAEGAGARVDLATRKGTVVLRLAAIGSLEAQIKGLKGPLPPGVQLALTRSPGSGDAATDPESGWTLTEVEASDTALHRFAVSGVPAGDAELWLAYEELNRAGRGTPLGPPTGGLGFRLAETTIEPGETASVETRLDRYLPGRLEVEVLREGAPVRDAVVELEPTMETMRELTPLRRGSSRRIAIARLTSGSGHTSFEAVPPGTWRIYVREPNWLWAAQTGMVKVVAGETSRSEIPVALCEGVIQITSITEPTAFWIELAPGVRKERMTDAAGRMRLFLGPGSYRLFHAADAPQASAEIVWAVQGPLEPRVVLKPR